MMVPNGDFLTHQAAVPYPSGGQNLDHDHHHCHHKKTSMHMFILSAALGCVTMGRLQLNLA